VSGICQKLLTELRTKTRSGRRLSSVALGCFISKGGLSFGARGADLLVERACVDMTRAGSKDRPTGRKPAEEEVAKVAAKTACFTRKAPGFATNLNKSQLCPANPGASIVLAACR
jgi:hypothetical protein